jgi:hypothetical protein
MTPGRSHWAGKARVGTGEHAHQWATVLRDEVEKADLEVVLPQDTHPSGIRLALALGARVKLEPKEEHA